MSRWQEAAPGIDRAKCVMRPKTVDGSKNHFDYIKHAHVGESHFSFLSTNDPLYRIISAARVESAVETATFLDICADEGLVVTTLSGRWYTNGANPAKTLRGAYLSYHERSRCE